MPKRARSKTPSASATASASRPLCAVSRSLRPFSAPRVVSDKRSAAPRMVFSGFRSSWLVAARKSDFARLAASAVSRASRSSSSSCSRRAISARRVSDGGGSVERVTGSSAGVRREIALPFARLDPPEEAEQPVEDRERMRRASRHPEVDRNPRRDAVIRFR